MTQWNTTKYHAIPCNTTHYFKTPSDAIQHNAICTIPRNSIQPHTIQWNTIQYKRSPCNAKWYHTMWLTKMQYNTILCNARWYYTMQSKRCNIIQFYARPYNTIQLPYRTPLCHAISCNTIQCRAIQYNTLHYNTLPCNIIH